MKRAAEDEEEPSGNPANKECKVEGDYCAICLETAPTVAVSDHECVRCAPAAWKLCAGCAGSLLGHQCPICKSVSYASISLYAIPDQIIPNFVGVEDNLETKLLLKRQLTMLRYTGAMLSEMMEADIVGVWRALKDDEKREGEDEGTMGMFFLIGAIHCRKTNTEIVLQCRMPRAALSDGIIIVDAAFWREVDEAGLIDEDEGDEGDAVGEAIGGGEGEVGNDAAPPALATTGEPSNTTAEGQGVGAAEPPPNAPPPDAPPSAEEEAEEEGGDDELDALGMYGLESVEFLSFADIKHAIDSVRGEWLSSLRAKRDVFVLTTQSFESWKQGEAAIQETIDREERKFFSSLNSEVGGEK